MSVTPALGILGSEDCYEFQATMPHIFNAMSLRPTF